MTSSQAIRPVRRRLEGISSRAWEHPADRAALTTMRSIPGFDEVLRKIAGFFGERGTRLAFQANSVRVGPNQYPRLHRIWLSVSETLDAPDDYELYVSQSPIVNAGTYGLDKPWTVLLSGSLKTLTDDEVEFVMGHEMGHILSGHALYHTMLQILLRLASANFPILNLAAMPVLLGLLEWYRKSEISCDRAGLLACQLPDAGMRTMMRLAGGGTDEEMNLGEFLVQADEYRGSKGPVDEILKVLNTIYSTHPFLVLRAAQLRDWLESGEYDRIVKGEYPKRGGDEPGWTEDLGAGLKHYTGGFQKAAEGAGGAVRRMRDAFERGLHGEDPDTKD
jgi:Zn-dependent protease with chaperone function